VLLIEANRATRFVNSRRRALILVPLGLRPTVHVALTEGEFASTWCGSCLRGVNLTGIWTTALKLKRLFQRARKAHG
jgi:hypothetical protein